MAANIALRRGTAAEWTAKNPKLRKGEVGLERDTRRLKFGDGTTPWTLLPYQDGGAPSAHAASHEQGGGDEISVVGLPGLLADPQTPVVHDIITGHNGFPGGTVKFLREDGVFATPPGTGTGASDDTLTWMNL